jgi:hypothetical protein
MRFWKKRQSAVAPRRARLVVERLEERSMLTVAVPIAITAGHASSFYDADGTRVQVAFSGPGQGSYTLASAANGGGIDTLTLTGTGLRSTLTITTMGGKVAGTTINDVVIDKAANQGVALTLFAGINVDLAAGGEFQADGVVSNLELRNVGANAEISVATELGMNIQNFGAGASLTVGAELKQFNTRTIGSGAEITAPQIDSLNVTSQAQGATIKAGAGGIQSLIFGNLDDSLVTSTGDISKMLVKGVLDQSSIACNILPGADGDYGTIDDQVADPNATGRIGSIQVSTSLGSNPPADRIVASGTIGSVLVAGQNASTLASAPLIWQKAATSFIPLSVTQAALDATGFDNSHVWVAVFGQEISTPGPGQIPPVGPSYYLDASDLSPSSNPILQPTSSLYALPSTPDEPILPSSTLADWGSDLALPVPAPGMQFTGRIVVSAGAPVQAQVNLSNGTVSAPSAASPTDPSNGTFYDFLEFTVTNNNGVPNLDIDTSQVDSFGMPLGLQFFQDTAGTPPFNFPVTATTTNGSETITNISDTSKLSTGFPLVGTGIPVGATIQSIVNPTAKAPGSVTLNMAATVTANNVQLMAYGGGPVGVSATRSSILDPSSSDSLLSFVESRIADGDSGAGAFLQTAAPYQSIGPLPISSVTNTGPITVNTQSTAGMQNGDTVSIAGVVGTTSANGTWQVADVTATSFQLVGSTGNGAYQSGGTWSFAVAPLPISSVSNPITVNTASTAGLHNGDMVAVSGVVGTTSANGTWQVADVTATSFQLVGSMGNGAYVSGGTWAVANGPVVPLSSVLSSTVSPITINTASTSGLANGDKVTISGVVGTTSANGTWQVADVTATSFQLVGSASNGAYVSGGTWAFANTTGSPIVLTTSNTEGMQNGDVVQIAGVQGDTAANGFFTVSNVTATSFTLDNSKGTGGAYNSGGTWSVYTPSSRLVSPKDVVEALSSPQDADPLNNYFNAAIDQFFLQYYTGTIGSVQGGGQTLQLVSNASGQAITYSGHVTNVGTANGGYVLQLKDPTLTDPNTYDIYYPFFTTNAPSPSVYTPLFPLAAPPSWITNAGQENESASQMMFGCDAVFADNVSRGSTGIASTVLGDLEDSVSAAFNRGVALMPASDWGVSSDWFQQTGGQDGYFNYWAEYWHANNLTYSDLAYAFPYDDKFGASTNLNQNNVGLAQITLGSWSTAQNPTTTTFENFPSTAMQQGPVTLTAQVAPSTSDPTPTGTVTFYINGVAINSQNNSASPQVQPVTLNSSGVATITALLPELSNGAVTQTYTVTAVYSGDSVSAPSIAYSSLQVVGPEGDFNVLLTPGAGQFGSQSTVAVTLPGASYQGTVTISIAHLDGTGSQVLAVVTPTSLNVSQQVTIPSTLVSFTGNVTQGSPTVGNVSTVANLVAGQTVASGSLFPAVTTVQSWTPATITLSQAAQQTGAFQFTSNGVTFSGTSSAGSKSIVGVVSATGLQATKTITGTGIASSTTISAITMPTVTLSNSALTTSTGVTVASDPLLSFTGDVSSTSTTIDNVSSVVNLTTGQTVTSGGLFSAGTTIAGFSPAVINLSQAAQQSGLFQFTSNGVTFTGTTSVGSASIVGVLSAAGLTVGNSITGTGLPSATTISSITMPTVTLNQMPLLSSSGATLVSNAINTVFPIQVVFTPTTGPAFSGSTEFAVT